MSDGQDEDKLALVPVQGNEMHNELALLNDELVVDFDDFLPVLEVQENVGVFEQVSDDGQSKQTVQQLQQMELRGMDTNGHSVHAMKGLDQKAVLKENADGKRLELTQEKTIKGVESTATTHSQHELAEKRGVALVDMKDGTKAVETEIKRQETQMHKADLDDGQSKQILHRQQTALRSKVTNDRSAQAIEGLDQTAIIQENAEGRKVELTQERKMTGIETTATSQTRHELAEKKTTTMVDMKDGTQAAVMEANRIENYLHVNKAEQEVLLKAAVKADKAAVKRDSQGLRHGVREQDELELHAQVSFDGSKQAQLSGKFRNVQLLSTETAEGTRIQFQQTKAFLGMGEDGELALENQESLVVEFTLQNYLRDPKRFVENEDVKNGFSGFLDILARQKKYPWGLGARILYKSGLLVFFLINFLYPIIVFAIEQEHAAYNIVCGIISFIGLVYESVQTFPDLYRYMKKVKQKWHKQKEDKLVITKLEAAEDEETSNSEEEPANEQPANNLEDDIEALDISQKVKRVLKEFVLDSLGELLIYPSIICGLYGFVNEKGWEFDGPIAIFDFLLLLYSLVIDVIYAKVYHVWLLLKVIRSSYTAHDEYERVGSLGWKKIIERIVTPFSMTIPYAVTVAIMHWLMLAIIGVRIYADNFSTDSEPTGSYTSAAYTRYMIFCGAYLPVASLCVYILLNKYWFLQIFWLIKNKGFLSADSDKERMTLVKYQYIKRMPDSVKTMAFLRDPLAYFAVIFLMVPFIPFTVGTFLPDYENGQVADGARSAAGGLGAFFIITFLIANCQAALIFAILIIIITVTTLYLLYAITHPKEMAKQAYREYRDNR